MNENKHQLPTYARSEMIADGAMHFLGVSGALTGAILLAIWTFGQVSGGQTVAITVYGLALVATFLASAIYNMSPWQNARPVLRRLDHAAIYIKIAGTYTPLVAMAGGVFAYAILATVWAMALFGIIRKLFFWRVPGRYGTVLYLVMGWISVAIFWPLIPILPVAAIVLIAVGGLLYSAGVLFHIWEKLKYSNAIWHGFVIAASACFYVAIALGVHHILV